jgi:hypothetical protein
MSNYAKLHPVSFGISWGLVWGLSVFSLAFIPGLFNYGSGMATALESIYPGFNTDIVGALIGFVLAFIDAGVGALIIAFIYNTVEGLLNN